MALPNVTFEINKSGLGRTAGEIGKVPGLIISGVGVGSNLILGDSYQVFSLKEAENLGIDEDNNAFAHKQILDFYNEARSGAPLWVMLVGEDVTMTEMGDINEAYANKLINDANGDIRVLGFIAKTPESPQIEYGLQDDVTTAVVKIQHLADECTKKYMPFRAMVSGSAFSGNVSQLKDYKESEFNRVSMLIGNNDRAQEASIGLALGRLARIPTQRSMARVKDGAAIELAAYFTNGVRVEALTDAWDAIHDKGYTFFRTFSGKSGYFFTDDQTLTGNDDDFSALARGLVIDEALLIAYRRLTEELNDDVNISEDGKIHPAVIKYWQSAVESEIEGLMLQPGREKISAVQCEIDPNQNILQNDGWEATLDIIPKGYNKHIRVKLGFTTKIEE